MPKHPTLIAVLCGLWMVSGPIACRTVNTTLRENPRAEPRAVEAEHVVTDPDLVEEVHVLGVREATVGGDLLKVQVDVRNLTDELHRFGYQFVWYDDQGMLVQTPTSGWRRRTILGGETLSLVGVAPHPSVVDFRLKLIEGND